MPKSLNPDGTKFVDLGLGGVVKKPEENGKFRVPTLRNATLTAPYMHNGIFKTLRQVDKASTIQISCNNSRRQIRSILEIPSVEILRQAPSGITGQ